MKIFLLEGGTGLGNSDARFWKKMQKTSTFGHLGQKGPFWIVFGQNGQNGENF